MNDLARSGHAAFTAIVHADRATIDARGELEIFTVELLRGALAHLALHDPAHITINLSGVTTVDRCSARLLLTWQNTGAPASSVAVNLCNPTPDVAAILAAERTPLFPRASPVQVDPRTAYPDQQPRRSPTAGSPHRHLRRRTPGTPRHPTSAAP